MSEEGCCKEVGMKIRKRKRIAPYKPCTYCGVNLASKDGFSVEDQRKRNMKPHIALTHSLEICSAAGIVVDDEETGASFKAFLSQLHLITSVICLLECNNYAVKPACSCFSTMYLCQGCSREYFLTINGTKRKVCKPMFKHTLSICDSWIDSTLSHVAMGLPDLRGKRNKWGSTE